jgi:hypothetical protein
MLLLERLSLLSHLSACVCVCVMWQNNQPPAKPCQTAKPTHMLAVANTLDPIHLAVGYDTLLTSMLAQRSSFHKCSAHLLSTKNELGALRIST